MRFLLTRPQVDARALARKLQQAGHGAILAPLLDIVFPDGPSLDLAGIAGVLLTSANGVRALGRRTTARNLPLFAVGDATARVARDLGFTDVRPAAGDVDDLAALVRRSVGPEAGDLLHLAGTVTAGDLAAGLAASGYKVRRVVAYEARPAAALPAAAVDALRSGQVDVALFYSPRTARIFADLVSGAKLQETLRPVMAVALSQAVGDALQSLPWRRIVVAEKPAEAALLSAIGVNIEESA